MFTLEGKQLLIEDPSYMVFCPAAEPTGPLRTLAYEGDGRWGYINLAQVIAMSCEPVADQGRYVVTLALASPQSSFRFYTSSVGVVGLRAALRGSVAAKLVRVDAECESEPSGD